MNAKEMDVLLKLPMEIRQKWEKNNPTTNGKILNLGGLKRSYLIISKLFWISMLLFVILLSLLLIQTGQKYFQNECLLMVTFFSVALSMFLVLFLFFKRETIERTFRLFKKNLKEAEVWDESDIVGESYRLIQARIDDKLTLLAIGIIDAEKTVQNYRYDNRIPLTTLTTSIKYLESKKNLFSESLRRVVNLGLSDGDKRQYFEKAKASSA